MAAPVAQDQELELSIDSLAYGGNGVARLNGFVVFVRRGLPGDRVRARVTKVKRNHAEALAVEVLEPGPQRVDAPCAHYPACGGCRFQDLAYEAQAVAKQDQVLDALRRIGGIAEPPLDPIEPAVDQFHYRNKMEYSFTATPAGPALGLHRAGRWDEVLEIERCWISSDLMNAVRDAVRDWARAEKLEPYDQAEHTGYLRHLVMREGRNTGQMLVQLVTAPGERFDREELVEVLRRFPEVRSIHWAVNESQAEVTNLPTTLLWGEEAIEEELCGLRFRVRPNAFLQTNTKMAEQLDGLAGTDGVGGGGLGGVGRLRARERGAERDRERRLLRRRGRRVARGAARPGRAAGRRRRRPAARGALGESATAPGPARGRAHRLRLVQPHHAGRQRQGAARSEERRVG